MIEPPVTRLPEFPPQTGRNLGSCFGGTMRFCTDSSIRRFICAILVTAAAISLPAFAATSGYGTSGVSVGEGSLWVAGTHTPFVPRGFNSVGVLYPRPYAAAMCTRMSSEIRRKLAAAEAAMTRKTGQQLLAMKERWGANTVRFQVSQGALAYEHEHYLSAYTDKVLSVIRQARAMGLVVIVSMQTQGYSCTPLRGDGQLQSLPDRQTEAAWAQLAPSLGQRPGVMLEIFNEPNTQLACGKRSLTNWAYGCGDGEVGMVPLARFVRKLAPDNVLLLDGDKYAETFAGFELPAGIPANTAYAIHPYGYTDGPADWDRRFGDFQNQGHAIVATEWNETSWGFAKSHPYFDRFHPAAARRKTLLAKQLVEDYLPAHHIGLIIHSWDEPQGKWAVGRHPRAAAVITGAIWAFR